MALKMKEIKFIQKNKNDKIFIPKLKSRGGNSISLPLMDYIKKEPLSAEKQILKVYENEANDLMRSWPKNFILVKKKIKREESEE